MSTKRFTHGIQLKFILFRLFNAFIIVLLGAFCIYMITEVSKNASDVIEDRLPKLQATKEVYAAVLESSLYGAAVLNGQDHHAAQIGDAYQNDLRNSFKRAYVHLDALTYGTESQEFSERNGQELQELGLSPLYVPTPSEVLASKAMAARESVEAFETSLYEALHAREELLVSGSEENGVDELAYDTAIERERAIFSSHAQRITDELGAIQTLLDDQINTEIARVNESNKTKQILITLIALLAVLITLFGGMVFSNRVIVAPLRALTKTAEEMADGKLSRRVKITSNDEIGKLAYTFNKLASSLQASYDNLEQIVKDKTDALSSVLQKLETKNDDLEKSQMATINLLEDLEEEKQVVEQRVLERTEELEREKNKLLQVTSNMKGGGILLDKEGNVVFTNEATFSMIGINAGADPNEVLEHFLTHFEGASIRKYFTRCLEGETFHVEELNGHGRVYELFFHYLQNDAKASEGYFILFFDITDAKLLERSKSELVAVASHQLRTPLTAMRGNVEMLIDESFGKLNKEQHELLDDIEVSTVRLITMVNEMLDITKIEKGDLEMKIEELSVKELVDSVVDDLSSYAERHEFQIDRGELSATAKIAGDRIRIRQIFQNLIDNAIKYSNHPGLLRITSSVQGDMVEIVFKDNGIGVPKNEQSKLFERFYRASNTAKTASSGSGLGLYIVKSIARQLGGDIRFESEEGVGTTFFVTLPLFDTHKA